MMRALAVWLALLPGFALAESLPALYDVTGVAAGDVLNVRSDSHAAGAKLGELAYDATDVEVVRQRNGWALVNVGEGAGWVSMRYLAGQPGQDGNTLSPPAWCTGTEPFWSLELLPGWHAVQHARAERP